MDDDLLNELLEEADNLDPIDVIVEMGEDPNIMRIIF